MGWLTGPPRALHVNPISRTSYRPPLIRWVQQESFVDSVCMPASTYTKHYKCVYMAFALGREGARNKRGKGSRAQKGHQPGGGTKKP